MPRPEGLPLSAARRIALAAQGFGAERPSDVGVARLRAALRRMALVQIDSVNVLARSHYLPFFSRLGGYDRALLDRSAWGRRAHRRLFEYWGHEASLLPVELHPLLRWRMARAECGEGVYRSLAGFARERRAFIDEVAGEVARRGPLSASDLQAARPGKGPWWGWSDGKMALEWLFWAGRVTTATRRSAGFERVYDLPERVLPSAILKAPAPPEAEAQRELLSLAARALGIATESDLRDYFRLPPVETKARLRELVESGRLVMAAVEGWERPAFLDPAARAPRRIGAAALLSPFDSLIWERARAERLFGFHYRIEIYTPAARRRYGYYVLPFLLGERLVGRVDLKADRPGRRLVVQAAFAEPGTDAPLAAAALLGELQALARWLGLGEIYVAARGDLAAALRRSRPSGRFPS
jgi:uncharacterized protein